MPESTRSIRQLPHFRVPVSELAAWMDRQRGGSWWSVDGDRVLMQRLDFPCPSDELAKALESLRGTLLLLDSRQTPVATGETLSSEEIGDVAYLDKKGDRVFRFCWEERPDADWLLVEDRAMEQVSRVPEETEE